MFVWKIYCYSNERSGLWIYPKKISSGYLKQTFFWLCLIKVCWLYINCTGLNKQLPLPAPKSVAMAMKGMVLKDVYLWNQKFGPAYKKLALGFEFMQTCKKVSGFRYFFLSFRCQNKLGHIHICIFDNIFHFLFYPFIWFHIL